MRVTVVGATKNFFKVGQATLRILAKRHPDVNLRLGMPDVHDARRAVPNIGLEFVAWNPAEAASLDPVLRGTDSMLLVPPIMDRIPKSRLLVDAAIRADVSYIAALDIQHQGAVCRMSKDAAGVEDMLNGSGIAFDLFRLPMFLENILYQVPSIRDRDTLTYPVSPDAAFSYVTCPDLAEAFCELLVKPPVAPLDQTVWTSPGQVTCRDLARSLSQTTGRTIEFVRTTPEEFVAHLSQQGLSETAARSVVELWDLIDLGRDVMPNDSFARVLGREPQSSDMWVQDHRCCFDRQVLDCAHPKPPASHMY